MNLLFSSYIARTTAGIAVVIGLQLGVCSTGFAASIDVDNIRASLLLQKEPAGAVTPTAAKAAVLKTPKTLVIAGRIAATK